MRDGLDQRGDSVRRFATIAGLLERADSARRQRHGRPIVIVDEDPMRDLDLDRLSPVERYMLLAEQHDERMERRPPGEWEWRPGGRIISVR